MTEFAFLQQRAHWPIAAACICLLPAIAASSPSNSTQRAAVDALFAEHDQTVTPGLAIGIYRGGQEVYAHGYGMADLESPAAITPETVFYAASVSKQFTAFAILLLAREGKLNLDADIRNYLPYVPDFGAKITVRHLLHHTSGLRDQWSLLQLGGIEEGSHPRQSQVIHMVQRQRALNSKPGAEYNYCNTGYTLLAEIVLATSGRTLREFTTERIFEPLQMRHTFFDDDVTQIVPRRARSYEKNAQGVWHEKVLTVDTVGATGLHATVGDFGKWAANFSHPLVGDPTLIRQFTSMGQLDDGSPINYGFALTRQAVGGRDAVLHTGVHAGFRAVFAYLPAEDFSVVMLANTPLETVKLLERVVAIFLGTASHAVANKIPARGPADVLMVELPGSYQAMSGAILAFHRSGDGMALADRLRDGDVPIAFRADGSFDQGDEPRSKGRFYTPVLGAGNRVVGVDVVSEERVDRYRRVQPIDPATVDVLELVGDYRSRELDVTYTLSVAQGTLVVDSIWFAQSYPLQAAVKDGFTSDWPLQYVAVERDCAGRPRSLLISSPRTRNVRFDRVP